RVDEVARREVPDERPPFFPAAGPLAEDVAEIVDALVAGGCGLTGLHLIGPDLKLDVLEQAGAQESPDPAHPDRQVDLEAGAVDRSLVEAVLRHEEESKGLEADVSERHLIALVILTEAAGTAGAGGKIDVTPIHFIGAERLALLPQKVRQVPRRKA